MNVRYGLRKKLFGNLNAENWIMRKNVGKMPGRQISRKEAERIAELMNKKLSMRQAREQVAQEVARKERNIW